MIESEEDVWLPDMAVLRSPNCNERPSQDINLVVIHNISLPPGQYGGSCIKQLFTNCLDCHEHEVFHDLHGVEVSAHFLIDREGLCTQFVPLNHRAWHAGESCFAGIHNCNDYSIGIELEGDDNTPYTELQYTALAGIISQLMACYPLISVDRIVGHSEVAPGRKTDPGAVFDWERLRRSL